MALAIPYTLVNKGKVHLVNLTCFYIPSSECLYSAVEWCTAAEKMISMTDVPYITLIVKK